MSYLLFLLCFSLIQIDLSAGHSNVINLPTLPALSVSTATELTVSLETIMTAKGPKTIIHCYGCAANDLSMLFGAVEKAIDLLEDSGIHTRAPIRVIGANLMGLVAAIELDRHAWHVVGITTKEIVLPQQKDSCFAYFESIQGQPSSTNKSQLDEIALRSFETYKKVSEDRHPYLSKECVETVPVYYSDWSGVDFFQKKGLLPKVKKVSVRLKDGRLFPHYFQSETFWLNRKKIQSSLTKVIKKFKVPIEQKEPISFDEINEPVIFNCCDVQANPNSQTADMKHYFLIQEKAKKSIFFGKSE